MLYVSIIVDLLRARPALAVWIAALMQAAVWALVPTLFYAGPPGEVPMVLAVGHDEFKSMGVRKIRAFAKKAHVLYDVKYLYPRHQTDGRL